MGSPANAWWSPTLRAGLYMLFGLLVFFDPLSSQAVFPVFFAVFAFLNGGLLLGASLPARFGQHRAAMLLEGAVSVAAGVLALVLPAGGLPMVLVVGLWGIATGLLQLNAARALRRAFADRWVLLSAAGLALIFGVIVLATRAAVLGIVGWFGLYLLMAGWLLGALGIRLYVPERSSTLQLARAQARNRRRQEPSNRKRGEG